MKLEDYLKEIALQAEETRLQGMTKAEQDA